MSDHANDVLNELVVKSFVLFHTAFFMWKIVIPWGRRMLGLDHKEPQ